MKLKDIDVSKLNVTGDRILAVKEEEVSKDAYKETESGLLIPTESEVTKNEPDVLRTVVRVGPNVENLGIREGATLIVQPFSGFSFNHGDKNYFILNELEVLGVVSE